MKRIRVYVIKDARRANLMFRWTDLEGRTHKRSSGTTSRRDAEREAVRLEDEINRRPIAIPTDTSWEAMRQRYEDEVVRHQSEKHFAKCCTVFNLVERHFTLRRIADIDAIVLSQLVNHLKDKGLALPTISGYLAVLKAFLNWSIESGLIRDLPRFPKIRSKSLKVAKGRALNDEEFALMLRATADVVDPQLVRRWEFLLQGLWWSGLRLSEALALTWDDYSGFSIDFAPEHPVFHIRHDMEKGGKDRVSPVAPEFVNFLLDEVAMVDRNGFVFKLGHNGKEGPRRVDSTSKVIVSIGKAAGIKVSSTKYASAHDLRRSFGFRWAMRVQAAVLKELMRHGSIDTTLNYYVGTDAQRMADVLWTHVEKR